MKKTFLPVTVLSVLCAMSAPTHVSAALIYAWDFAGLAATTTTSAAPATVASTIGSATLDLSAFGLGTPQGTGFERTSFSGTFTNTFPGITDGNPGTALAIVNSSANGKSMIFSFGMLGYEDLVVTFGTRGTSTGFDTGTWAWSTDNVNFTTLVGVNTATRNTTFQVATADFSSEAGLDNAPTAYLRYTLSGATSTSGNNRLDNIQFNAIAVPEPSTFAFAAAGLVLFVATRTKQSKRA
jgi:hypothetical protein